MLWAKCRAVDVEKETNNFIFATRVYRGYVQYYVNLSYNFVNIPVTESRFISLMAEQQFDETTQVSTTSHLNFHPGDIHLT